MTEWKPIGTAPKDGTTFVALTKHNLPCTMYYSKLEREFRRAVTCRGCACSDLEDKVYWTSLPNTPITNERL